MASASASPSCAAVAAILGGGPPPPWGDATGLRPRGRAAGWPAEAALRRFPAFGFGATSRPPRIIVDFTVPAPLRRPATACASALLLATTRVLALTLLFGMAGFFEQKALSKGRA